MILPKARDPRLVTIRRGGTLTDADHRLLALWAAQCAEHVVHFFEEGQPSDTRPREAIEATRAWARGDMKMMDARARGGHAMGAARPLQGAARYAAYAAGQTAWPAAWRPSEIASWQSCAPTTPLKAPLRSAKSAHPSIWAGDGEMTSAADAVATLVVIWKA